MNTSVNFELAKLLKEKKFEIPSSVVYHVASGTLVYAFSAMSNTEFEGRHVVAPTIAEVIMWLYDKHGIWIEVYYDNSKKEFYTVLDGEEYKFNSPTEAYKAAIEYVLTKII